MSFLRQRITARKALCLHVKVIFFPQSCDLRHHRGSMVRVNGRLIPPLVDEEIDRDHCKPLKSVRIKTYAMLRVLKYT